MGGLRASLQSASYQDTSSSFPALTHTQQRHEHRQFFSADIKTELNTQQITVARDGEGGGSNRLKATV